VLAELRRRRCRGIYKLCVEIAAEHSIDAMDVAAAVQRLTESGVVVSCGRWRVRLAEGA